MAEIINLKIARKHRARLQKETTAEENRQRFGQTKTAKKAQKAEDKLQSTKLDGHRLKPASEKDE
ncbi:MAG: DUF4169 family protein [Salaquimonas sp.]